jgi:hypothetical protein
MNWLEKENVLISPTTAIPHRKSNFAPWRIRLLTVVSTFEFI